MHIANKHSNYELYSVHLVISFSLQLLEGELLKLHFFSFNL